MECLGARLCLVYRSLRWQNSRTNIWPLFAHSLTRAFYRIVHPRISHSQRWKKRTFLKPNNNTGGGPCLQSIFNGNHECPILLPSLSLSRFFYFLLPKQLRAVKYSKSSRRDVNDGDVQVECFMLRGVLISVTRLFYFRKVTLTIFLTKVAQISGSFLGQLEKGHFSSERCFWYFLLATF